MPRVYAHWMLSGQNSSRAPVLSFPPCLSRFLRQCQGANSVLLVLNSDKSPATLFATVLTARPTNTYSTWKPLKSLCFLQLLQGITSHLLGWKVSQRAMLTHFKQFKRKMCVSWLPSLCFGNWTALPVLMACLKYCLFPLNKYWFCSVAWKQGRN